MNCLTARLALTLSLLGGLAVAGDAGASAPAPQQRAGGAGSMNARAIQDIQPTLELLITVRLLAESLDQRQIVLDARASQELGDLLRPLSTTSVLRPNEADVLNRAIRTVLTPSQERGLTQARAVLEARVQAFMARARFAAPDGPLNFPLIRYGLMVPGGQATVTLLLGTPLNPFSQAGGQANLLVRVLALLEA